MGKEVEYSGLMPEIVVTPRGTFLDYKGTESQVPDIYDYLEAEAQKHRVNAVNNIVGLKEPEFPIVPNQGLFSKTLGYLGMSPSDRMIWFGYESNPATCIYTATKQFEDNNAEAKSNKLFKQDPGKYGFHSIPLEQAERGDLIQYVAENGTPKHMTMVSDIHSTLPEPLSRMDKNPTLFLSYSNGNVGPSYIDEEGKEVPNMKVDKNIKWVTEQLGHVPVAYRYHGSPSEQAIWRGDYKDKYKNRTSGLEKMHAEGGQLSQSEPWDNLPIAEKSVMMRIAIKNGITNLKDIKQKYNEFAEGGSTSDYTKWKQMIAKHHHLDVDNDPTYDYQGFYNKYPSMAWAMLSGSPDAHFTDEFKTVYHPTFSNQSVYSGKYHPVFNPQSLQGGTWSDSNNVFTMSPDGYRGPVSMDDRKWYIENAEDNGVQLREADGSLPMYNNVLWGGVLPNVNILGNRHSEGGSIHIKPSHRGRLTELKERTGKTEAELYNDGNPAHRKMVVFARNARKWHADGGPLDSPVNIFRKGGSTQSDSKGLQQRAMRYFMDKGLTDYQAAGLVGNLMRESRLQTTALNSGSGAMGIAQWLGPRKKELIRRYGNAPTLEQQLDFVWDELNTTHKNGLRHIKASKDAEEAARNTMGYYAFSAGPEEAIREMNKHGQNGKLSMQQGIDFANQLMGLTSSPSDVPMLPLQPVQYPIAQQDNTRVMTPAFMPDPEQVSFYSPSTAQTAAVELPQPIVDAANDYYTEQMLAEEDRQDRLNTLSMVLSMNNKKGRNNKLLSTINMLKGNMFAEGGPEDNTQQMQVGGTEWWKNNTGQSSFLTDAMQQGQKLRNDARQKAEGYIKQRRSVNPIKAETPVIYNDNIWVEPWDTSRPKNPGLYDPEAMRTAEAFNRKWREEHPTLNTLKNILSAAPFAVAAVPVLATAGSGLLALGDAAAATTAGQAVTAGLAPLATAASTNVAGAPLYSWADAGLSSAFAAHGADKIRRGDIHNVGDVVETGLDLLPLTQLVRPIVNTAGKVGNAVESSIDKATDAWRYRGINAGNTPRGLLPEAKPLIAGGTPVESETMSSWIKELPLDESRYYRQVRPDALESYKANGVVSQFNQYGHNPTEFDVPMFSKGHPTPHRESINSLGDIWIVSKPKANLEWETVNRGAAMSPKFGGEFNKAPISEFDFYQYDPARGYFKLNEELTNNPFSKTPHVDYLNGLSEQQQIEYLTQNGLNDQWLWTLKNRPEYLESTLRNAPIPDNNNIRWAGSAKEDYTNSGYGLLNYLKDAKINAFLEGKPFYEVDLGPMGTRRESFPSDWTMTKMSFSDESKEIINNSAKPRILAQAEKDIRDVYDPTIDGPDIEKYVKEELSYIEKQLDAKINEGYELGSDALFKAYDEGKTATRTGGLQLTNDGKIVLREGENPERFAVHEWEHRRTNSNIGGTHYGNEKRLLRKAFTKEFRELSETVPDFKGMNMDDEMVTTVSDTREALIGKTHLRKTAPELQNKMIDKSSDERIFAAVEKANAYGYFYIKKMRELGKLTPELAQNIREALKHIGAYAAPVGIGLGTLDTLYGTSDKNIEH